MQKTFSFLISSFIINNEHNEHKEQLVRCIDSIRQFHKNNTIYIITNTEVNNDENVTFKEYFKNQVNILFFKTINDEPCETRTFRTIVQNDINEKIFIMQDSMLLNKPLQNIENIEGVQFIWHFTNHVHHWDHLNPETNLSHTDLIRELLNNFFYSNKEFLSFSLNALDNKTTWCGCFGFCCIIDKKTLLYMNEKVEFIDNFLNLVKKSERVAGESIFALVCHFLFPEVNFYNSYDGLYYDGITTNPYGNMPTGFGNSSYWLAKREYISKMSFRR